MEYVGLFCSQYGKLIIHTQMRSKHPQNRQKRHTQQKGPQMRPHFVTRLLWDLKQVLKQVLHFFAIAAWDLKWGLRRVESKRALHIPQKSPTYSFEQRSHLRCQATTASDLKCKGTVSVTSDLKWDRSFEATFLRHLQMGTDALLWHLFWGLLDFWGLNHACSLVSS